MSIVQKAEDLDSCSLKTDIELGDAKQNCGIGMGLRYYRKKVKG